MPFVPLLGPIAFYFPLAFAVDGDSGHSYVSLAVFRSGEQMIG